MLYRGTAHSRAGLVGNPSDGYFGKTISFIIRNFQAGVLLWESPDLEILPNTRDRSRFDNIDALAQDVLRHGYYGGIRLLKSAINRFYKHCREHGLPLHARNFTLRYHSDIPSQVGLAGSSAIITACMRALMQFYDVSIPKPILANLILAVENKELGIPAGLQDRVTQVYEGLVYMDFNRKLMDSQGYGNYEELDPALLPPVYVAYRKDLAEGTEVFHNDIRGRFDRDEPQVVEAMKYWAHLTDQVRDCLIKRDWPSIGVLLNKSFDKRRQIYRVSLGNIAMIETARSVGASASFTGSGGAIVGTFEDGAMYQRLVRVLEPMGVHVFKPVILQEPETGG